MVKKKQKVGEDPGWDESVTVFVFENYWGIGDGEATVVAIS